MNILLLTVAVVVCQISFAVAYPAESKVLETLENGQADIRTKEGFLLKQKPTFAFLFRPTAKRPITTKRLINILKPQFSERGSNSRVKEEAVYMQFLRYMKEVAAGRRGAVKLESIMQFTTGTTEEPLLGFEMEPSILFVDGATWLPTSCTCANILKLSTYIPGDADVLFSGYDIAFLNTYFGVI